MRKYREIISTRKYSQQSSKSTLTMTTPWVCQMFRPMQPHNQRRRRLGLERRGEIFTTNIATWEGKLQEAAGSPGSMDLSPAQSEEG